MDTYFELKFIHERGPRPRQSEAMPSIQGKIKTFMDILKRSMNLTLFKNKLCSVLFLCNLIFFKSIKNNSHQK